MLASAALRREDRLRELRPFVREAQQLQGWQLAYEPIALGSPFPWDYEARARQLAATSGRLVDLGTGGGEVLGRILAGYIGQATASESWGRNARVARRNLDPLGVPVVQADSYELPFGEGSFDLVLDRHEALRPAEVARVLRPGGAVLTQQVSSDYHHELRAFFPRMTVFEYHELTYPQGFRAAGLEVVSMQEQKQKVAYRSLGQLVYHLVAAPWTIPDFSLEPDLEALLAVERDLGRPEGIVLSYGRYLLEARKPSS